MKSVYVLDDGGAFGVGIADSFEQRAKELGMKVLGRDRLDPKEADYKTILTKIKGLNPDALYYGGVHAGGGQARPAGSTRSCRRSHKAGSDGVYDLAFPRAGGQGGREGWWASSASPDLLTDKKATEWVNAYKSKMKREPTNYSITAYNAVKVIADAIDRTVKANKPVNRSNVRDAIQGAKIKARSRATSRSTRTATSSQGPCRSTRSARTASSSTRASRPRSKRATVRAGRASLAPPGQAPTSP